MGMLRESSRKYINLSEKKNGIFNAIICATIHILQHKNARHKTIKQLWLDSSGLENKADLKALLQHQCCFCCSSLPACLEEAPVCGVRYRHATQVTIYLTAVVPPALLSYDKIWGTLPNRISYFVYGTDFIFLMLICFLYSNWQIHHVSTAVY